MMLCNKLARESRLPIFEKFKKRDAPTFDRNKHYASGKKLQTPEEPEVWWALLWIRIV